MSISSSSQNYLYFPPSEQLGALTWMCCESESHPVRPTLWDPMDYIVHGILQARILEWVAFPFSRDLPKTGIKPRSVALQVDSLPAEPQGKPKNTGLGSLSHHQQIFPTQESNWGLPHCRWIPYQLSYEGSPLLYILLPN